MATDREEERSRRWYFSREQLASSPSRADGVEPEKELRYRQDAASLIQEMGPRLSLNPLCLSTAIVYMHRFYMIHSFKAFDRAIIATAAVFLAAKVEELPRKLEHVAKCSYKLIHKDKPDLETGSDLYQSVIDDITHHELILLQTLGFDVQVRHPHPHVVECMNLVGVSKDLSHAAFFLAHNSQLLTTFCLQHKPTVVACMCIHLTCAWKGLEIPRSSDNKNWWEYVEQSVTWEKLEALSKEFLTIVDKSPSRLKKRIQENIRMAKEGSRSTSSSHSGMSSSGASTSGHSHQPHPQTSTRHRTMPTTSNTSSKHHTSKPSPPPPPPPPQPSQPPHPKLPHHPTLTSTGKSQPPLPRSPPPTQSKHLPPPPPTSIDTHKHRSKHKEHSATNHKPPHNDTSLHSRPQKHFLPQDLTQKHKRLKTEPHPQTNSAPLTGQPSSKQQMSLNTYRQNKRQGTSLPDGSMESKVRRVHQDSPSLPPLLNHANSSHVTSRTGSHSNTNNHGSLPLLPPLPRSQASLSPPPPPPPP